MCECQCTALAFTLFTTSTAQCPVSSAQCPVDKRVCKVSLHCTGLDLGPGFGFGLGLGKKRQGVHSFFNKSRYPAAARVTSGIPPLFYWKQALPIASRDSARYCHVTYGSRSRFQFAAPLTSGLRLVHRFDSQYKHHSQYNHHSHCTAQPGLTQTSSSSVLFSHYTTRNEVPVWHTAHTARHASVRKSQSEKKKSNLFRLAKQKLLLS